MRIVGGKFRGRRLASLEGRDLRPTSDRVREAVFNIIEHGRDYPEISGASVADLFAGTGSLALEAMSRGAAHATLIDNDAQAVAVIRKNSGHLGVGRQTTLLKLDASRLAPPPLAAQAPCSIVFIDPPYGQDLIVPALIGLKRYGWIENSSLIVAEMGTEENLEAPNGFKTIDERAWGAAKVLFLTYAP